MMKIILAFDSFKGSMTAEEACHAAAEGVRQALPEAEVVELPLADGGEGTTEALCRYHGAVWQSCMAHDALMRLLQARYAVSADGQTAIMDMAATAGLTLLAPEERHPLLTTTFGVGEMLCHALDRGCRRVLMGIGGSATCDGGMGLLAALGMRFLDSHGRPLDPVGGSLEATDSIDDSRMRRLEGIAMEVICDVTNPLYGPDGAAYVYAPQKGATPEEVERLDRGLRHLARLCPVDATTPGSGAAGGLGYALLLLGSTLRKGAEVVLEAARLRHHLRHADLVITGEGKIDRQTLSGKLPFAVLQMAHQEGVPVMALAGLVEHRDALIAAGFCDVRSINPEPLSPKALADAMQSDHAKAHLRQAVARIVK